MKKGVDYIGVGVGAAIFDEKGRLFIAKRGEKARNERGKWEIPGGSVEFGETFEQAIKREIKEELDIEIEITELLGIYDHIIPDEKQHWVSPTYICQIIKGTPKILEPDKCAEIGWFTLEDAQKLPLSLITSHDIELLKEKIHTDRRAKIMYNTAMAKRNTGVGKGKKSHSYKTKKRLEIKREMLAAKKAKRSN